MTTILQATISHNTIIETIQKHDNIIPTHTSEECHKVSLYEENRRITIHIIIYIYKEMLNNS